MRALDRKTHANSKDAEFVRAALAGDPGAAPAIVSRFAPLVRHCLGRSLGTPDLDDHVQEVFARCFANLASLRKPASLRSFIIGITLRFASTERRRLRHRSWERLTATGELPEMASYQDDLQERRTIRWVRDTLDRVRPETRHVLELRFVEERELTEVAEALGVSLATAKRQLGRASARVRSMALGEPMLAETVPCGSQMEAVQPRNRTEATQRGIRMKTLQRGSRMKDAAVSYPCP